jgi:hypothetical protein
LANQHDRITAAGGRLVGISVDSPGQNAAMVQKLGLPFPLLSDPGGERAIKPYGVWDQGRPIARPAVVIVGPDRAVHFRYVGDDFVDRLDEEEITATLQRLGLPATSQDPPKPGRPAPGPRAIDLAVLPAQLRGGRFAVLALAGRVPEAQAQAETMIAVYDRLIAALAARRRRS